MPPLKTIRTVPKISIAALQAKLDKQLAMCHCLRAINQWGSGRLEMEYAVKSSVADFGYSKGTAYRILSDGDGLFWEKRGLKNFNRLQIKIYGFQKVAKHFDVRCGGYFVEIPVDEFADYGRKRVLHQRA